MTVRAGRPRGVAWLVAVLAVVLTADLAVALTHPATRPVAPARATELTAQARVAPEPTAGPARTRTAAITALLGRRAAAILSRDRAAFAATVDPADPALVASQLAVFDNLAAVPLAGWSYELAGGRPRTVPADAAARYRAEVYAPAEVVLHYRLRGYDERPTALEQYLTFVHRPAGWFVGGTDDFIAQGLHSARQLWDFGPVAVVRGTRTLVLGHPGAEVAMRGLAAEADADIPRVTAVWGTDWPQRAVLVVPGSQQELSSLIGSGEDLDRIAAVATAELGGAGQAQPVGDRILVNPDNFERLGTVGRRVVVTHELTHVATRAATSAAMPAWLVEGFADYVGWLGSGVPPGDAAREVQDAVRAGRLPSALPTDAAFDGGNIHLGEVYGEAWLACRFVARHWSQQDLVRLYRAVGAAGTATPGTAPDDLLGGALRRVLHTDVATFTADWRADLRAELS